MPQTALQIQAASEAAAAVIAQAGPGSAAAKAARVWATAAGKLLFEFTTGEGAAYYHDYTSATSVWKLPKDCVVVRSTSTLKPKASLVHPPSKTVTPAPATATTSKAQLKGTRKSQQPQNVTTPAQQPRRYASALPQTYAALHASGLLLNGGGGGQDDIVSGSSEPTPAAVPDDKDFLPSATRPSPVRTAAWQAPHAKSAAAATVTKQKASQLQW